MNPTIGTREEWRAARLELLEHEKQLTRLRDEVAAERRQLPWVRVDTEYVFDTLRPLHSIASVNMSLGGGAYIDQSLCDAQNASTKAAMSVMPKVITAEFFRRGLADRLRCVAVAPGYVGTAMVKGMNQKALEAIIGQVPIGRLVEPEEVAMLVGDIYRNEALAGDVFFIHGGLRLGSKG